MEAFVTPAITALAGCYFLIRNIVYWRDEAKLKCYLESSLKAKPWTAKFGIEKAITLSRKYFLPLGIAASVLILSFGILGLVNAAMQMSQG